MVLNSSLSGKGATCPQSKVARRNRQQGAPGEYRCPLPTGLVYDEAGNVVLDPDAQVREAIANFFETFSRVGSASQTVKMFRIENLVFPCRLRADDGTVFRSLTTSTAMRMLHNPTIRGRLFKQKLQRHRSGHLTRLTKPDAPHSPEGSRTGTEKVPKAVVSIEDLFQESPVGTSGEGAKVCSSVTAQLLRGYAETDGTNAGQSDDQSRSYDLFVKHICGTIRMGPTRALT